MCYQTATPAGRERWPSERAALSVASAADGGGVHAGLVLSPGITLASRKARPRARAGRQKVLIGGKPVIDAGGGRVRQTALHSERPPLEHHS